MRAVREGSEGATADWSDDMLMTMCGESLERIACTARGRARQVSEDESDTALTSVMNQG